MEFMGTAGDRSPVVEVLCDAFEALMGDPLQVEQSGNDLKK
jgi:hypothetical protein